MPQLLLEKLVSNRAREGESACACVYVRACGVPAVRAKERITGHVALLCSSPSWLSDL